VIRFAPMHFLAWRGALTRTSGRSAGIYKIVSALALTKANQQILIAMGILNNVVPFLSARAAHGAHMHRAHTHTWRNGVEKK
jgi:hypothetical protein